MEIEIKNFRGVEVAGLAIEGITLVGGSNAAGKSSIAQAVGAALCANPLPVRSIKKADAWQMVLDGASQAVVEITAEGGSVSISWPKCAIKTEGRPPMASEFAAGLSCVLNLPTKERSEVLSRYLKAEPTREDLDEAVNALGLEAAHVDKLWDLIGTQGWDGAHAQVKEKGARLKGQWEEWTKERYGAKKAESWLPAGWEPELEGESEEALQAAVVDARDCLEGAISAAAVDDHRLAELEERAAMVDPLRKKHEEAEELLTVARDAMTAADAALQALPVARQVDALSCPHCHKPSVLVSGRLVPSAEPIPEEELAARRKALEEGRATFDQAKADHDQVSGRVQELAREIREAVAAAKELDGLKEAPASQGADVEACRTALAHTESRLRAWQAKTAADNRHYNIQVNAQLVHALSAEGVRLTRLSKALGSFNGAIKGLCDEAGWGAVSLDENLEAAMRGRPYGNLCESEKYRVRTAIQLWMASTDGSAAVVIDGADILVDKDLRNGLLRVLLAMETPALVCMAMTGAADLPDLAARQAGQSYWLSGGRLVTREAAIAAG